MKTTILALLAVILLAGCKKENESVIPGGHVPSETRGQWMYGSFSMSEFWSYDGRYQGNPFELAVMFDFKKDGTYEKYFVATTRDYAGCKTEAFTFEKGSVDFNETAGSFTTTPTEGHYRGFYSCFPNKNINRKMDRSELKPQTYYYEVKTGSNGRTNLVVRFNAGDSNVSTFLPTSW